MALGTSVLGQRLILQGEFDVLVYAPPDGTFAKVTSFVICNQGATEQQVSVRITTVGEAPDQAEYVIWRAALPANDSIFILGDGSDGAVFSLAANQGIYGESPTGATDISFSAFGVEKDVT